MDTPFAPVKEKVRRELAARVAEARAEACRLRVLEYDWAKAHGAPAYLWTIQPLLDGTLDEYIDIVLKACAAENAERDAIAALASFMEQNPDLVAA
jgi:hypothetical protein